MSADIIVTMELVLKPEAVSKFAQMDKATLEGTRNFPGCRGVQIVMHKDEPARILFIERWESEEAYRSYIDWRSESGQFQGLQAISTRINVDIWPQTIVSV